MVCWMGLGYFGMFTRSLQGVHLWQSKGTWDPMPRLPPRNKALIRPHSGTMVVNSPLIRPYFLGGWHCGGPLRFHDSSIMDPIPSSLDSSSHSPACTAWGRYGSLYNWVILIIRVYIYINILLYIYIYICSVLKLL